MGKKIRLSERELVKLIKNVIVESNYSEEDLKYTHPVTGKSCKIKVAENKLSHTDFNKFGSVLVCEDWDQEMVVAELPVFGPTFDYVKNFICDHVERTYEILDEMLSRNEEHELSESINHRRWIVIDDPINCKVNYGDEKKSEESPK